MSCPLDEPQRVEEERNVAGKYYLIIYIYHICALIVQYFGIYRYMVKYIVHIYLMICVT